MNRQSMQVEVADGALNAYVVYPDHPSAPAVVVLQEIFGVNADLRATCEELAGKGFIAVSPELFWREAPGLDLHSWSPEEWKQGLALYEHYDFDRGVRDIAAVVAVTRALQGCNGKVGVMGFCLGGLMTYLTAARSHVDAAAWYYGGQTERFLGESAGLAAPIIMHVGEEDEFVTPEAQRSIKEALGSRLNVEFFTYPGCYHAFARHSGTRYDAAAASLANGRTEAFLHRHLANA
ncbi:dienelactone hydrolase family protein [Paraburkholderia susongensis]|uniref:Carboxymethylenebutenolidase n=1 Tax=Paraburkholderia susongensis TaxID=1515439 RepID=A0A1X7M173_9BURK|nr:dienelactone hydrolase family protein [Paraburkholderia susongensis]SMG59504.1 carboxymethylenebutenolidase [Paraburkholderia susongensis]